MFTLLVPIWIFYFLKNQNDNCTADNFDIVSIIHCSDLEYVCFKVFSQKMNNIAHAENWTVAWAGHIEPSHHRYLVTF